MKGNNGSTAQVTNPAAAVTKKRGRVEENQSQQPAAASTNPVTPPPAKRRKINGVPAASNASAAPISSSSSSSSSARNADDMPSLDDLFREVNGGNDAMDVDSAPNSGGNEMPASASSSSSSAEPNIKRDPVGSFSQDPLDLLSGAATYDPNAVMPEQSADQPSTPPILLSAAFKDVKDSKSLRENLQKIKDLAARYISGTEVISAGLTNPQKSIFLAGVIANGDLNKADEFLKNHLEDSQESIVLTYATFVIVSSFDKDVLDFILKINSKLIYEKDSLGYNILHIAAENKDGGNMLRHILSKLSAEDKKAMLAATTKGNTPLIQATGMGDVEGFDLLMENGQSLRDIKNYINANLLHIAAQNKDGGNMLRHILSKLSAEDKKAMLAATTTTGNTPLMEAAAQGDIQGFDLLMENGQSLRDINNNNNLNLLHAAASNKDGGKMLQHIFSKLSAEDKKVMLAATTTTGNTPLMEAAAQGDIQGFDLLMENGQSLKDVKKNDNTNLLHLAACNKDGGKMLQHIFSKLSADDKKAMLAARDSKGNMPLMFAATFGDAKGFEALQSVTENWKQNQETLKALVLATQKNSAFKKHFEENYPNEYKLGQGIVNMSPQAPAPRAVPAPRAAQPKAQPSAGRVSPPNNQNGMQNLPAALAQQSVSIQAAPQPPLASSGSLSANPSNALTQTAMSSLDLFKALEQSIAKGPQTPISSEIMARLKLLEGLLMGHEAVIASQRHSNEAPSRSI